MKKHRKRLTLKVYLNFTMFSIIFRITFKVYLNFTMFSIIFRITFKK